MKAKTSTLLRRGLAFALSAAMTLTAPGMSALAETEDASLGSESSPFIKADGKDLRTDYGKGDIINLRGTNAGGYLLQEFWMTPSGESSSVYDQTTIINNLTERFGEEKARELIDTWEENYWQEEDFANVKRIGMNCIRLPFWWRNIVDENGNYYGYDENADDPYAEAFKRLDWFVNTAAEYGIYVVLDMHGAPGSQSGSDHSGVDGKNDKEGASKFFFGDEAEANQELYYSLWKTIADRYEGNPYVAGYDLLNEPYCTYRYNSSKSADELHTILWDIYDKAYDVIRAEDPDHVVIMEATWNPEDLPDPAAYGWENVMYEYHNYLYDDYDNLGGGQILNMENKTNAIGNAGYNVPSYLGEFCYFNNLDAWDEGLQLLTEYGLNWTTWTYKTINGYGNWGLFHHPEYMDKGLDISKAEYDEIDELWGNSDTVSGNENTGLTAVVSKWCAAPTYENSTHPVTAEPESDFLSGWKKLETEDEDVCTITGGKVEEQSFYSGGKAAGNMNTDVTAENVADDWSNINYLTFTVKAADKGTYPIVMHYNGDDDKEILVKVGEEEAQLVSVPRMANGQWDAMHDVVAYVNLEKGNNTVKISGALGSGWMNIDYIATTNHYVTLKDSTLRLEGEFFYTNCSLEGQTFFSAGKAVGNLNNDIALDEVAEDWSNMKYVDFTIYAQKVGDYNVTWHWNGNGADGMVAVYRLNDGENVALTLDNAGASWNEMNKSEFVLHLEQGFNDFKLSGTILNQDNWANIDCIDIINTEDMIAPDGFPDPISGFDRTKGDKLSVSEDAVTLSLDALYDGDYRYFVGYKKDGEEPEFRTELGTASLTAGENTVTLDTAAAEGEEVVFVDFSVTPITIIEETGAERYEAEDFGGKSANNPVAEHQDFYSGRAHDNGVGGMGATVGSFNVGDDIIAKKLNYRDYSIFADKAGTYTITVAANGNGADMTAVYQINGEPSVAFDLPNKDQGWDHMIYTDITVELTEGYNRLVLGGTWTGDWLNYDYIDVVAEDAGTPVDPEEPEDPEEPVEPVCEHEYVTESAKATLTEDGYVREVCSLCGEVASETVIPHIADVTLSVESVVYTGKAIVPTVTAVDAKGDVISADYYTVAAKNNKKVGTATVTVTFKDQYEAVVSKQFIITPKAVSLKSVGKGFYMLDVTWNALPDQGAGYEVQLSTDKNFKASATSSFTIKNAKTDHKLIPGLSSKKTYYIRVRAVSSVGNSAWSKTASAKPLSIITIVKWILDLFN
ncbi:cellulase family glycosylhydrolase [Butyrivibrio sp. MC2013]|uniref:cellulase family glycosylhydrolase n=1 Tax=Butyrivibrio sp. MC2013 TaxID=1280686 RepID=UPI0004128C0A|nr:cellulase family glycosylhydrolase [Butyrivibrio sp. MC2013]